MASSRQVERPPPVTLYLSELPTARLREILAIGSATLTTGRPTQLVSVTTRPNSGGVPLMQISALFDAVRRRLLPLLAVAILAVLAGAAGFASTRTAYDATAVGVVVPGQNSPAEGVPPADNPFDKVGHTTTQLATLLTVVAQSTAVQEQVTARTGATLVSANNTAQERTSAPQPGIQVVIVTRGDSPQSATAGGTAAIAALNDELKKLQTNVKVPAPQQARLVTFVPAEATASSSTSRLRAAGGLFLGVSALGTVAVLGYDAWRRRRAARSAERGSHRPVEG